MIRPLRLAYPFLFVVLPVLNILTRSPGESSRRDMTIVIATMLLGCGVVYGLVLVASRRRSPAPVVPLIVLAVITWFYAYGLPAAWADRLLLPPPAGVVAAAAVTVGLIWWLARRPGLLDPVTRFLGLTGLFLVIWLGGRVVRDQIRARRTIGHSALARDLARPLPPKHRAVSAGGAPVRDIYLILLDEYANSSVLRERFGFDNRMFEDSLRRLGFTIPRVVHSNYTHTILSLPSLLNFSHLNGLASELGPEATDPSLPNYLLENNRTVGFLKARGYQFFFFPSQWWFSTEHNRNADWEFQAWPQVNVGREATRSDLRRSLVRSTALNLLLKDHGYDADYIKRTLAGLQQIPEHSGPTFTFAHVLSPHRPYVFGPKCETLKARVLGSPWGPSKMHGYTDQLQCINGLVLGVVTDLLRRSSVPPVIILQGDHGTRTLLYSTAKTAAAVSPAQSRERFGAFGAYYLPAGGGRLFADSVTLVNVFRKVLNYYFDAGLPLAPDDLYMSLEQSPYRFVRKEPSSVPAVTKPPSTSLPSRVGVHRGSEIICGSAFSPSFSWRVGASVPVCRHALPPG